MSKNGILSISIPYDFKGRNPTNRLNAASFNHYLFKLNRYDAKGQVCPTVSPVPGDSRLLKPET
jgi:hypothetical protein